MKTPATIHPALSAGFLSRLADGETTGDERADFEAHRADCSECDAAAAEYEAVLELYRAARVEGRDPALASRIVRRLDARLAEPARMHFLPVRLDVAWAATLVVALAAGLLLRAVVVDRARRERESRILIADRIKPLPPPAAPSAPMTAKLETNSRSEAAKSGTESVDTGTGAKTPERPRIALSEPAQSNQSSAADGRLAEQSLRASARSPFAAAQPAPMAAARPARAPLHVEIEDLPAPGYEGSVPPARIVSPPPDDSSWAAWTKASGSDVAVVRIDVGADGSVTAAEIVMPETHRDEDALVLDTVRNWRFRPARRDEAAVAGTIRIRLRSVASAY